MYRQTVSPGRHPPAPSGQPRAIALARALATRGSPKSLSHRQQSQRRERHPYRALDGRAMERAVAGCLACLACLSGCLSQHQRHRHRHRLCAHGEGCQSRLWSSLARLACTGSTAHTHGWDLGGRARGGGGGREAPCIPGSGLRQLSSTANGRLVLPTRGRLAACLLRSQKNMYVGSNQACLPGLACCAHPPTHPALRAGCEAARSLARQQTPTPENRTPSARPTPENKLQPLAAPTTWGSAQS